MKPLSDRLELDQAAGLKPALVVVIDTEEEFDWDGDFDPEATSVDSIPDLNLVQEIFDDLDIRPIYVVDHPVASDPTATGFLRDLMADGRATIGAHLHPWVNPPVRETVNRRNSFVGNLPPEAESEKLLHLTDQIEASFGVRPQVYKAGRYGLGPSSARILEEQGYLVDLSACPAFDFSPEGGPDYSGFDCRPFWIGAPGKMLGLPTTNGYVGFLRRQGWRIQERISGSVAATLHLPGILSRLSLFTRLRLSPEGFDAFEMRQLTESLLRDGVRTFSLSFHSPSVRPGCTPYVRDEASLESFLKNLRDYLKFFLDDLGGRSVTPLECRDELLESERRGQI